MMATPPKASSTTSGDTASTNGSISSRSHYSSRLKLYAKPGSKSNNMNTIQKAILKALEGAANAKLLQKMQETIDSQAGTCNHFLILFRNRHQFKGLYKYEEKLNTITKLSGMGPKTVDNEDISLYYKFDTTKRQFLEVQTKHISLTIIAFAIQDYLWSRLMPVTRSGV